MMATLEQITKRIAEVDRDIKGMEAAHAEQYAEFPSIHISFVSHEWHEAVQELDFLKWFQGCLAAPNAPEAMDENIARDLYISYIF